MKSDLVIINNDGPIITSTTYWDSHLEAEGKIFCSCNAGIIRLLVPRSLPQLVEEFAKAKYVVLSRGPWWRAGSLEAVEFMLEDDSDDPYCIHLQCEAFDFLPKQPPPGHNWSLAVLSYHPSGVPKLESSHLCYWRQVPFIPCAEPWSFPHENN